MSRMNCNTNVSCCRYSCSRYNTFGPFDLIETQKHLVLISTDEVIRGSFSIPNMGTTSRVMINFWFNYLNTYLKNLFDSDNVQILIRPEDADLPKELLGPGKIDRIIVTTKPDIFPNLGLKVRGIELFKNHGMNFMRRFLGLICRGIMSENPNYADKKEYPEIIPVVFLPDGNTKEIGEDEAIRNIGNRHVYKEIEGLSKAIYILSHLYCQKRKVLVAETVIRWFFKRVKRGDHHKIIPLPFPGFLTPFFSIILPAEDCSPCKDTSRCNNLCKIPTDNKNIWRCLTGQCNSDQDQRIMEEYNWLPNMIGKGLESVMEQLSRPTHGPPLMLCGHARGDQS